MIFGQVSEAGRNAPMERADDDVGFVPRRSDVLRELCLVLGDRPRMNDRRRTGRFEDARLGGSYDVRAPTTASPALFGPAAHLSMNTHV